VLPGPEGIGSYAMRIAYAVAAEELRAPVISCSVFSPGCPLHTQADFQIAHFAVSNIRILSLQVPTTASFARRQAETPE
jgi:hypothetical protein